MSILPRAHFFALLWLTAGAVLAAAPDFPALTGRVVDEAGILPAQAEAELVAQLAAHEQATSNQIVVVTLKSLRGYDISDYGYQLGRHWGIGQKGKNNGALLIVAPAERKLRIEVGYGLEGVLTDAVSRDIIERAVRPHLRQQNYEQGIRAGVGAMLAALSGEPPAPPPVTAVGGTDGFGYLFFLFFLAPLLASFGRVRAGKQPSLGSRLWVAAVFGAVAGAIVWFIAQMVLLALVIGFVVFVLALLSRGRLGGDGGHYGGGPGGGWGGGDSGGFSGGGGSFGGGGASGDW